MSTYVTESLCRPSVTLWLFYTEMMSHTDKLHFCVCVCVCVCGTFSLYSLHQPGEEGRGCVRGAKLLRQVGQHKACKQTNKQMKAVHHQQQHQV